MAGIALSVPAAAALPAVAALDAPLFAMERERQRLFAVWQASSRKYDNAEQTMFARRKRGEPVSAGERATVDSLNEIEGADLRKHDALMHRMFETPAHTPAGLGIKLRLFQAEIVDIESEHIRTPVDHFVSDVERLEGAA